VARKKDAEEDQASKAILDQLQTKTVGAPPSSTGLTGDQLPETIFSVANFDQVKNQVTLQLSNLELLNVLNTIGQVTNTQSQSGPIPKTGVTAFFQATNSGTKYNIFQPGPGEVYLLGPCSFQLSGASGSVTVEQWLYANDNIDGTKRRVLVGNSSSSSSSYATIYEGGPNTPIHVDENGYVAVEATGTFTSVSFYLNLIRVR
jgi:hypothetical protein